MMDNLENLPKSWRQVTVCQMLEISKAKNSLKDIKHIIDLFIDSDNLSIEEFMEASAQLYELLQSQPKTVECDKYTIDGVEFTMNNIEDFSVATYVDFDELSKDRMTNLPIILGLIYRSSTDTGEDLKKDLLNRSRILLNMDFETATSALVFFSKRFMDYTDNFLESLEKENPTLKNQVELVRQSLGGTTSSSENPDGTSRT